MALQTHCFNLSTSIKTQTDSFSLKYGEMQFHFTTKMLKPIALPFLRNYFSLYDRSIMNSQIALPFLRNYFSLYGGSIMNSQGAIIHFTD